MTFANNCRPNNNQAVETCTQEVFVHRSYIYISGLHPKNCDAPSVQWAATRELQGYIPNIFTLHQIDMTGAGIDPSLLKV
jgi:hypothetical protein